MAREGELDLGAGFAHRQLAAAIERTEAAALERHGSGRGHAPKVARPADDCKASYASAPGRLRLRLLSGFVWLV